MKPLFLVMLISVFLLTCSSSNPQLKDYLGVYRIIKIDEQGEIIKTPLLNHIELTHDSYISRIDKNKDNRFSADEIIQNTYKFSMESNGNPSIQVGDDVTKIFLKKDNYYDLIFQREGIADPLLTLYTKKARYTSEMKAKKNQSDYYGSYKLIKIRENGKILNIGNRASITLSEDLYISEFEEKITSSSYTFYLNQENKPYIKINNSEMVIWIMKEATFDLLLLKIDEFGNETIMYLKINS